ncbi:hypothetical protein ElyMa_003885900 [Elysia marginata]|uniref:Ig-like domain-containing protein n=1 Tax=Elysia marginata TaxID=1093978 RepID=A0AAV4FMH1_9GAST|nr:hypothetical protein ElyMa_003885900 [Elysia marginata]
MANTYFILVVLAIFLVHTNSQDSDPLREEAFAHAYAADGDLEVSFKDPSDRYVELGAEVNLEYVINRSPLFGLKNHVYLWRNTMKDGKLTQGLLSDTGKLSDAGIPEFYNVEIDTDAPELTIRFKIKKVRDIDDATIQCQVVEKSSNLEKNISLNIIVLRDNDKLQMKFGKESEFFSESMTSKFEVDAGKYPVECQAEGSNPATDKIHVFWKGEEVQASAPTIEKMDTPLQKYRSTVKAEIDIVLADSGQNVECVATSKSGNKLTIKAPIKVNVYVPEVKCVNGDAHKGKRYSVLSCFVNETGHDIESYAFEFGKTGHIVKVGDQNAEYDEVTKEDLGNNEVRIDLTLYQVKDTHFSDYYLIIEQKNGHVTKKMITLNEVEGPNDKDSSSMNVASLVTLAVCALCAMWKTL